ncbi:MAG TPA: carboxypeptidase regulatory-like domain-containing protein [Candidatus Eremiobacteraceae bacterium]|nr:carboxypeptidase regulatory-like domain-containing protein [Candidatus Eremiobacteraceae bacterium]
MKSNRRLLTITLVVLTFCAVVHAQDTASLTGTVTDSSGAAVPGAQVVVTDALHGINRTAESNGSGDFLFASLPIGSYDLTVSSTGFKKYEAKGIILRVADKARVNVALQVGAISTEVIVQGAEVAQVETQSSELAGEITGKEISQLELNGRDFTQLVALSPGVTNQSGADEGEPGASTVAFSVNGGRTEYNNFEVDGGDSQDNGSNTTLNVYPSIDAIAEVKVLTSNYGAQYGRNGSGTVEVETKSGTSSFHGDLYEFIRNDAFNATQFGETSVPAYKKHDFGGTIGGPVYIPGHYNTNKQKTFFFWSEEWRRELIPATNFFSTTPVPTVADRGGNFTDQCPNALGSFGECPVVPGFTNSSGPAKGFTPNLSVVPGFAANGPVNQALNALIPLPNLSSGNVGAALDEWYNPPTLPTHWRQELFKVDHNINDKIRASFRYIHDSWTQQYPVPLWTDGTSFPTVQTSFNNPGVSMVAHLTANVSPTLLNEFVASYTTDHISTSLTGPWQRPSGFPAIGLYNNGFGGKVPGISVADSLYNFSEDPGYVPQGPLNSNPTFTYRDTVTKVVGSHNFQFGAYVVNAHKNEIPQPTFGVNGQLFFANTGNTVTSGNAYADLLLGNISSYTQEQNAFKMHEEYNIYEAFFQDDWHATRRLTLNLGLRMSFYGTYREKNNLAWNFDPSFYVSGASSVNPVTGLVIGNPHNGWVDCGVTPGVPSGCLKNHWWNPAPRIGFAFDPKGDGKWAIRGGYGIFFEHTNGNEANTESLEQYNINTQTTSVVNVSGYNNLNSGLLGGGTTPLSFVSLPNKATWPYVQQWNLDIQHDLGRSTVATIAYVGSAGVHLTRTYSYNQMVPVPASLNPYAPGQVITPSDCGTVSIDPVSAQATATVNGRTTTGSWANNLAVACGNNANPYLPFAGIGSITRKDQTASSNYNAFEATVRHQIGGLELNVAYTFSHSIDDSSDYNDLGFVNSYNLNAYRASSDFDQRHNVTIAYVYDLPFFKGKGMAHTFLGGWQWSGITLIQSGSPFSVYNLGNGTIAPEDNAGVSNNIASAFSYPDLVGNPKANVSSSPLAGSQPGFGPLLYNPAAFVAPTGLTFGDAGRNILQNPWRENFDMALIKHFAITESKYFEFRAEAFNVFNHTEFSYLGGDAGSAADNANGGAKTNANQITCYGGPDNSAGDPSCAGLPIFRAGSAHLARILQLALKFIF